LKYLFENLKFYKGSKSQSESPFGSEWVHSLVFSHVQM